MILKFLKSNMNSYVYKFLSVPTSTLKALQGQVLRGEGVIPSLQDTFSWLS